ncbi:MAG: hypothetical protein WAV00_15465 [Nocardioides sp.]
MTSRALALRLRRVALDWVVPTVILLIGMVNVSQQPHSVAYPGPPARHLAFLAVAVVGLGLRRRAPLLAPCLTIAVVTWWATLWPAGTQGPFEGFLLMVGAAYCLGSIQERRKLAIGAAILAAWFVAGLFVDLVGRVGDVAPIAVWLAIGFGVGYLISRRTEQARQAWEATRVLAAEQQRQTARAVEDERARIARELHDVVAHGVGDRGAGRCGTSFPARARRLTGSRSTPRWARSRGSAARRWSTFGVCSACYDAPTTRWSCHPSPAWPSWTTCCRRCARPGCRSTSTSPATGRHCRRASTSRRTGSCRRR